MKDKDVSVNSILNEKTLYRLCLGIHLVLLLVFAYYKIHILTFFNFISVCVYFVGNIKCNRKEEMGVWKWIAYGEIFLHSFSCNVILGWGFGFVFYGLVLIPIAFRGLYSHVAKKQGFKRAYILSIASMICILLSALIDCEFQKVKNVPISLLYASFFVNMGFSILALIVLSAEFYNMTFSRETALRAKNIELKERINYDVISGAMTRAGFYETATKILHKNPNEKFCIVCSDILDFKLVNDLFGEEMGDKILRTQATLIQKYMKDKAVLGRVGSDKFALLVPQERFSAEEYHNRIREMKTMYSTRNFHIHMYVGVYMVEDNEEPIGQMCDKAFIAINKIKGNLHKVFAYYDQGVLHEELDKHKMVSEFEDALEKEQFCIHLQPQTDSTGKIFGAEALIRWNHPELGLIMPGKFIEHFEKAGIIYKLDAFVWEAAAKLLAEWKKAGQSDYYISVNISALDFFYMDVYQTITDIVEKYDILPKNLHIEITETAFSERKEETQQAIRKLYEAGYIIEIDDFGSGYSSLRFLKDVSANVVKIDREFLRESSNIKRSKAILTSIIQLTNEIDMNVIAEGVEVRDQIDMLSEIGCECFQGYYFSKPLPVKEFEEKYGINNTKCGIE